MYNYPISWSEEYGHLSIKYTFKSKNKLPCLKDFLIPTKFFSLGYQYLLSY